MHYRAIFKYHKSLIEHPLRITASYQPKCVIPENIHTSPTEGIFSKDPPPPTLWILQLSFIRFFKFFGLTEPPNSQEIPIPSVGGVWTFSGTAQCKISAPPLPPFCEQVMRHQRVESFWHAVLDLYIVSVCEHVKRTC